MITEKELGKLTRDKLLEKVEDYGLQDEVAKVEKEAGAPVKAELVKAIFAYMEANAEVEEVEDKDTELKPVNISKLPKVERKRLQLADLMRKECVIVIDNQNATTKIPARYITWGNRVIGIYTDVIDFENEKGAYIRRGALQQMRNQTFSYTVQKEQKNIAGGGTDGAVAVKSYPRYSIIPAEGLTEKQITQMKVEQKGKLAFEMNTI